MRVADDNQLEKHKHNAEERRDVASRGVAATRLTLNSGLHLSLLLVQVALQPNRIGEKPGVPGEVALVVRVVDVQPDDVVGDAVAVEAGVHGLHVGLVAVAPAALVVAEGEERRQGLEP